MKIQPENLDGAAAQRTSRTSETPRDTRSEGRREPIVAATDKDSIQTSSLANRIAGASAVEKTRQTDRVASIAALYARGGYSVKAADLGRSLIAHALRGAIEGGE